jgi:hypothetical protein
VETSFSVFKLYIQVEASEIFVRPLGKGRLSLSSMFGRITKKKTLVYII